MLSLLIALPVWAATLPDDVVHRPSALETTPSSWSGDSVDDPAIWVNPDSPGRSLVVGNNKKGALEVYDLDGSLRQKITNPKGFRGNVDVRGDLVVASKNGMMLYRVFPDRSEPLALAKESAGHASTHGEGLCLYDTGAPGAPGGLYGINSTRTSFRVRMHPLTDSDNDGLLSIGAHIREFYLGSEVEACVVDDATGYLYISEESVGIWRYNLTASGTGEPPRVKVDEVGPHLAPDVEGLTLAGNYLIASAQNVDNPHANWLNVYDKDAFALVKQVRVTDGATSDDCDQTDGIAASTSYLGENFPYGLFVCQDGFNSDPMEYQSFKFARLELVLP